MYFLCARSGEGLISFNKNNRAIFSEYNEEVFQGVFFSIRKKNYLKVRSRFVFESWGLRYCSTCTKPNSPSNFKWAAKPETAQSSSPRSAVTQTYTWIASSRALSLVSFVLLFRDVLVRLFNVERASLILTKESAKFACPDLPRVGPCGNA